MSEIEGLQGRIMAALDKLAKGVETLDAADAAGSDELKQALAQEQSANAELSERVRVLADRQETALAAMEAKASEAAERMQTLDVELQRLRRVNAELQTVCEALRDANEEGVGEPHLINRAMVAELDAMKAMRKTEIAEADEIIAALMPLLSEGNTETTQETSNA